jgi:hypothetical protein
VIPKSLASDVNALTGRTAMPIERVNGENIDADNLYGSSSPSVAFFAAGNRIQHQPTTGAWYFVIAFRAEDTYVTQFALGMTGEGVYWRKFNIGTTGTAWSRFTAT